MKKERLVIDTDMGNDDIMAISMLLASPRFNVLGYTLTDGVSKTHAATKNLQGLLRYLQKPAPLAVGPERKFKTDVDFPEIDIQRAERLTMLKGLNIKPEEPALQNFSDLICDVLNEPITLVALGPMTNIASLVQNYPDFSKKITRILMMGGGISSGNVAPYRLAEYNIALDPPSADVVFRSGMPITMVGIDATKSAPATKEFEEKIKKLKPRTRFGKVIQKIVTNNDNDFDQYYDPLAVSPLIDPEIIDISKRGFISVEQSGISIGQTVFEEDPLGNTEVVFSCNSPKFYSLVSRLVAD